ncbi:MAG: PorP/SprF family type IX secretion system membrane protein [Cyclobacteriaceae bacterium]
MKHFLTIIALNLAAMQYTWPQDPVFSQFYSSALYLNPALSGLEEDIVLGLNYRSQWAGVNLPFRTFQFSAIHPIIQHGVRSKHLGGFSGSLFSDEAGPNREVVTQGFSVASAYNFHLNRSGNHLISTALQFGVLQRHVNMDALQWSSQYSSILGYDRTLPGENLISDRVTTPVINAGLVWRLVVDDRFEPMKMYYQGFAVSNLNRPKGFFEGRQQPSTILMKAHGGYLHSFGNGLEISPNYLIQYQKSVQINVGGYAAYSLPAVTSKSVTDLKVSLGFWYRIYDSIILTTGISTSSWNAGFSYDANTSSLGRNFGGANAFEFSFAYKIKTMKEFKRISSLLL